MVIERKRGRAGVEQRKRRLARTDGLCEHCLKAGFVTIATVVNHIVALIHGGSDDDGNTENLCKRCDQRATAKQFGHAKPVEARGVDRSGRPVSADHPWNRARRTT